MIQKILKLLHDPEVLARLMLSNRIVSFEKTQRAQMNLWPRVAICREKLDRDLKTGLFQFKMFANHRTNEFVIQQTNVRAAVRAAVKDPGSCPVVENASYELVSPYHIKYILKEKPQHEIHRLTDRQLHFLYEYLSQ